MSLDEIMEKCAHLDICQKRQIEEDFIDIVVYNKDMKAWKKAITEMFGEALKPAGVEPTEEHQDLTRKYNGICSNQTLFVREAGDKAVVAMFWPWQEEKYTTIKIGLLSKEAD